MVRRISLGITTLPRSSILLTIPVAFIYKNLLFCFWFALLLLAKQEFLCKENDKNVGLFTLDFFSALRYDILIKELILDNFFWGDKYAFEK